MTIFLALRNYYLRMALIRFMSYLATEMLKALNDLSTPDFSELFQLNESLYGLRSNGPQKLCIPNINSVRFGKGSIRYFGPVIWNSIPAKIKNANILSSFKKKIQKWKP